MTHPPHEPPDPDHTPGHDRDDAATAPAKQPAASPPPDQPAVDWPAVKEAFALAIEAPTDQRPELLRSRLGSDTPSLRQARALLAAHDRSEWFFVESKGPELPPREPDLPGTIGPYEPLQRLGEGGFGVVYRARQRTPVDRDVALKLLKPGLDAPEVLARFAAERQYLARIDHPDIVKVLDAGATHDGRAFVAMELVQGRPITDAARTLPLRERVALIRRAARAVHAVHQRGVIHRDLKPTNILVGDGSDGPRLRIIDFGIAAAAEKTERTGWTVTGLPLGTPKYASPEQAAGKHNADTRTDVYALGMVLCETITGRLPRPPADSAETAAAPPSRLAPDDHHRKPLRGDLDRIVLKAVAWDPDQRYDSAAALADDLQRYLDGKPVLAARPGLWYTARKFVARRPDAAAALAVAALSLILGVAALAVGLNRATQSEAAARHALADAQAQRDRADAVADFLLADMIGAVNPSRTGKPVPTTTDLLRAGTDRAASAFPNDPHTALDVLHRLADAHAAIDDHNAAAAAAEAAARRAQSALGEHHPTTIELLVDSAARAVLARPIRNLQPRAARAWSLAQTHLPPDHPAYLRARLYAGLLGAPGVTLDDLLGLPQQLERAGLRGTPLHLETLTQVGYAARRTGRAEIGRDLALRAAELAPKIFGPLDQRTIVARSEAAAALLADQQPEAAEEILLELQQLLADHYPPDNLTARYNLYYLTLAAFMRDDVDLGLQRAREYHQTVLDQGAQGAAAEAAALAQLARGAHLSADHQTALQHYQRAVDIFLDNNPDDPRLRSARLGLARALHSTDHHARALEAAAPLLDPDSTNDQWRAAAARLSASILHTNQANTPAARALLQAELDRFPEGDPRAKLQTALDELPDE